jgi:hypothetical protein
MYLRIIIFRKTDEELLKGSIRNKLKEVYSLVLRTTTFNIASFTVKYFCVYWTDSDKVWFGGSDMQTGMFVSKKEKLLLVICTKFRDKVLTKCQWKAYEGCKCVLIEFSGARSFGSRNENELATSQRLPGRTSFCDSGSDGVFHQDHWSFISRMFILTKSSYQVLRRP